MNTYVQSLIKYRFPIILASISSIINLSQPWNHTEPLRSYFAQPNEATYEREIRKGFPTSLALRTSRRLATLLGFEYSVLLKQKKGVLGPSVSITRSSFVIFYAHPRNIKGQYEFEDQEIGKEESKDSFARSAFHPQQGSIKCQKRKGTSQKERSSRIDGDQLFYSHNL